MRSDRLGLVLPGHGVQLGVQLDVLDGSTTDVCAQLGHLGLEIGDAASQLRDLREEQGSAAVGRCPNRARAMIVTFRRSASRRAAGPVGRACGDGVQRTAGVWTRVPDVFRMCHTMVPPTTRSGQTSPAVTSRRTTGRGDRPPLPWRTSAQPTRSGSRTPSHASTTARRERPGAELVALPLDASRGRRPCRRPARRRRNWVDSVNGTLVSSAAVDQPQRRGEGRDVLAAARGPPAARGAASGRRTCSPPRRRSTARWSRRSVSRSLMPHSATPPANRSGNRVIAARVR